eukprot:2790482-Rhodomonas_salina.1
MPGTDRGAHVGPAIVPTNVFSHSSVLTWTLWYQDVCVCAGGVLRLRAVPRHGRPGALRNQRQSPCIQSAVRLHARAMPWPVLRAPIALVYPGHLLFAIHGRAVVYAASSITVSFMADVPWLPRKMFSQLLRFMVLHHQLWNALRLERTGTRGPSMRRHMSSKCRLGLLDAEGAKGSRFTVRPSGFMVHGSQLRVQGSLFTVHSSGFRVQGSGFGVSSDGGGGFDHNARAKRTRMHECACLTEDGWRRQGKTDERMHERARLTWDCWNARARRARTAHFWRSCARPGATPTSGLCTSSCRWDLVCSVSLSCAVMCDVP